MAPEDFQYIDKYTTPSETPKDPNRIIVVGVGGGGNNAVNYMYRLGTENVSYVVVNTDQQALNNSTVPNKLLIGPKTSFGRGAGNDPTLARTAAEESAADIAELFNNELDMAFITAGMGGGTGTGAAPIVARIAKERGLLTIGIVTIPFMFEGMKKIQKAINGADEMSKYVDAIMIINNERLIEIYPDFEFELAFAKADDILATAASSIAEIITKNGYINLDFNDVNTTLKNGGTAIIAVGYGEGENRVSKAINDALNSPLLKNTDVHTSKRILFNLYYSRTADVKFNTSEASELANFISQVEGEVDVIWGITYDETLGEKVKFTILASGFDVTINDDTKYKSKPLPPQNEPTEINKPRISDFYGTESVEKLERERETRNYILLAPDMLDNDAAIEQFEKSSTLSRIKRQPLIATAPASVVTPASTTPPQQGGNIINFNDSDFD